MANSALGSVVRCIRDLAAAQPGNERSDAQLLEAFIDHRDQDAFTALVKRHGPMVLSVCRSLLGQEQDAEDAFQVVFLTLARHATRIRKRAALASWLRGVAYRTAQTARRASARRRAHEARVQSMVQAHSTREQSWHDVQTILHQEVDALPERYRLAFVLCDLEGKSRAEAARELSIKEGNVSSRLERARQQLARRGIELTAVLGSAALAANAQAATIPARLLHTTVQAALQYAAGTLPPTGLLSAEATALLKTLTRTLFWTRGKVGALFLLVVFAMTGAGLLARSALDAAAETPPPRALAAGLSQRNNLPALPRATPVHLDNYGDPLPLGAIARLGTVRLRREDQSSADVTFTADGKALVSARTDKVIQFWDAKTGKPLQQFRQDSRFDSFCISACGNLLVTGGWDGITARDMATRKIIRRIRADEVSALAASPDGKTVAVADKDRIIRIWAVATGKVQQTSRGHAGEVFRLIFSPDAKVLFSAGPHSIRAWDMATGRELRRFLLPNGRFNCVALSTDGSTLVSGGTCWVGNTARANLCLWDAANGKVLRQFVGHQHGVDVLSLSHDGKTLASAEVSTIHIWDVASGKERRRIERAGHLNRGLAFSPDGKVLAGISPAQDSLIHLWDVASGKALQLAGPQGDVRQLAFSPDGRLVAIPSWFGFSDGIRIWDAQTGRLRQTLRGHQGPVERSFSCPTARDLFPARLMGCFRGICAQAKKSVAPAASIPMFQGWLSGLTANK